MTFLYALVQHGVKWPWQEEAGDLSRKLGMCFRIGES